MLKVVLLCAAIGGSAIGFVWQKSQIEKLGRQFSERENQLKQLKNNNKLLADQISFLHNPVVLDRRVKELNLGLTPEQPAQVVRLMDLPPAPLEAGPRQFAQRPVAVGTP